MYHRVTEFLGLEGACGGHPVQALPRQGHLEQVTQECVQVGLECPREGDSTAPWATAPGLCPLQTNKFSLMLGWNLLCFSLGKLLLVLLLGTTLWHPLEVLVQRSTGDCAWAQQQCAFLNEFRAECHRLSVLGPQLPADPTQLSTQQDIPASAAHWDPFLSRFFLLPLKWWRMRLFFSSFYEINWPAEKFSAELTVRSRGKGNGSCSWTSLCWWHWTVTVLKGFSWRLWWWPQNTLVTNGYILIRYKTYNTG